MEISLAVQMQGFILATVAGFALAILYDALKMVRTMIRSTPSHVFWMDLAFMAVAGIVTFLLALAASYGEVRFYLLAGEGIGFCLYFMTFGLISSRVIRPEDFGLLPLPSVEVHFPCFGALDSEESAMD